MAAISALSVYNSLSEKDDTWPNKDLKLKSFVVNFNAKGRTDCVNWLGHCKLRQTFPLCCEHRIACSITVLKIYSTRTPLRIWDSSGHNVKTNGIRGLK